MRYNPYAGEIPVGPAQFRESGRYWGKRRAIRDQKAFRLMSEYRRYLFIHSNERMDDVRAEEGSV